MRSFFAIQINTLIFISLKIQVQLSAKYNWKRSSQMKKLGLAPRCKFLMEQETWLPVNDSESCFRKFICRTRKIVRSNTSANKSHKQSHKTAAVKCKTSVTTWCWPYDVFASVTSLWNACWRQRPTEMLWCLYGATQSCWGLFCQREVFRVIRWIKRPWTARGNCKLPGKWMTCTWGK